MCERQLSNHRNNAVAISEVIPVLRKKVREVLIRAALRAKGYSNKQIDKAFEIIAADTGKPILDWLINGGFEEILQWIIAIIDLFKGTADDPGAD